MSRAFPRRSEGSTYLKSKSRRGRYFFRAGDSQQIHRPRFRHFLQQPYRNSCTELQRHLLTTTRRMCPGEQDICSTGCSFSIFAKTGRLVRQSVPRSVPDLRCSLGALSYKSMLTDVNNCKKFRTLWAYSVIFQHMGRPSSACVPREGSFDSERDRRQLRELCTSRSVLLWWSFPPWGSQWVGMPISRADQS